MRLYVFNTIKKANSYKYEYSHIQQFEWVSFILSQQFLSLKSGVNTSEARFSVILGVICLNF